MTPHRSASKAMTWLLIVGGALGALHLSGRGALASPALTTPGAWPEWMAEQGPEAVVVSVLRLVALGGCWYLLAVTVIGIGARLIGSHPLVRATDALTVPAVRDLVGWAVGISIVAATAVRASPAVAVNGPPPTIIMTRLPDATSVTDVIARAPAPALAEPLTTPPTPPRTWVVRPGESFWSIASNVTEREHGRSPSEREITAYWRALIDANRGTLADPDNVDLIFAGQVFRVPPVPAQ